MTKEELEKEAEEIYQKTDREFMDCQDEGEIFTLAYLAGAEPREKRIAKLESQNKELKKWLKEKFESCASENLSFVAKYDTVCQELDSSKAKIAELEAQIEKMKCCGNCIHCKYDENEESYEFCEKHQQVVNIAIVPCSEWKGR